MCEFIGVHFLDFWCVCLLCKHVFFYLPCVPLSLQMLSRHYVGFSDGSCRSTQNLSFIAWALFAHDGELIDLQGKCLGRTTNNIVEYNAVIELLSNAVALGIRDLVVKLDSQLVVLLLNNHYSVRKPHILRMYLCV